MQFKFLFSLVLFFTSTFLYAGITLPVATPGSSSANTENRAYAGLHWTLKDQSSWIPDLILGFRSLRVKTSDSVNGGDLSARIKLFNGVAFDSVVLSYVGGQRNLLGNVGLGYSLTNASVLGTAALQGPYTKIGTDFQFNDKKFAPYFQFLTLDKPNNVDKTTGGLTCPQGEFLVNGQCLSFIR